MARGELMKKLLASYGRDEEFRAVAEQIISEEEKKNNVVLARSLRKTLENPSKPTRPKALAPLIPFPEAAGDFIERVEPVHSRQDIVLSHDNVRVFAGLLMEFRSGEQIRRRGLSVRSKLLFCGPPGCGKTLCAEIFASEVGLPLYIVKLDRLISSYLGETAANIRKLFEFSRKQPCVLFFDEFDALARARDDAGEHNELRRVVNSLLIFIDRIKPAGFLIAATNLDRSLDPAVWRRFEEVVWFDRPDDKMIRQYLGRKFKNVILGFDPSEHITSLAGFSFADIERVCVQAIKAAIVKRQKDVRADDFEQALADERRRRRDYSRLENRS
ncbi:ATP-binding protein [Rhizobium sp. ZPR3]|uniref:ATP-binding protein n=2 Tax=unclassified Rhizobium TaxID=2613769 RepID=A0AAU7S9F9_9HYPH